MKKGAIPPYPQFYELLYTYASGVNPSLNAKMNELLGGKEVAPAEIAEQLYDEFLRNNDLETRVGRVSQEISGQIDSVHSAVDRAMNEANSYSGSLKEASGLLDKDLDKDALSALAARLLDQTNQMQQANAQLETQLQNSRNSIATLQSDLEEVRKDALTDPLTKLYNRKGFDQGLEHAIEDAREQNAPLCLIMIDIDHFKKFNDTFGHQTGDQVLRLVASMLKANVKGKDMATRYGGEEFAAILPNTTLQGAATLADNIRRAIQAKELLKRSTNEKLGRITASFGIAQLSPTDTMASLIERADQALYSAKQNGRNQVVSEISTMFAKSTNAA